MQSTSLLFGLFLLHLQPELFFVHFFVIIEFAITRNIYGFDNCVKYLCEYVSIENIYAQQTQLKQHAIREIFEIVW